MPPPDDTMLHSPIFDSGNTGTFDSGTFVEPPETFQEPINTFDSGGTGTFDSGGTFDFDGSMPPPDGNEPPPPTSFRGMSNLFANILSFFNPVFR